MSAAQRLVEARRAAQAEDDPRALEAIRVAQQGLVDARLAAQAARRAATQQGSGAPGDRPRLDAERGALVDVTV